MKLRNKKTGDIVNAMFYAPMANYELVLWKDKLDPSCHEVRLGNYKTLTELNEEWEDCTLKEPLVKNEKIRKAVKAWAEMFNIKDNIRYMPLHGTSGHYLCHLTCSIDIPDIEDLKEFYYYTLAELIGEEK